MASSGFRPSWGATEWFGITGIAVMLLSHLVWDPVVTLVGVAEFGVKEEDTPLVRSLIRIHPAIWILMKLVLVGGLSVLIYRGGIHRELVTAWLPWFIAIPAILGPIGWIELLL